MIEISELAFHVKFIVRKVLVLDEKSKEIPGSLIALWNFPSIHIFSVPSNYADHLIIVI